MKVLVAFAAVLAAAVAAPRPGYLGAAHGVLAAPVVAHGIHPGLAAYGPAHIVVGPGGYLLDTPEVAATRAAHLTAVAQTQARDAHINGAYAHAAYAAPAYAAPGLGYAHGHLGLHG